MEKRLKYFYIGNSQGGQQTWSRDPMLKLGGCAIVSVTDILIYLKKFLGVNVYPYTVDEPSRKDYVEYMRILKPYLGPGFRGVDTLEMYMDGFNKYMSHIDNRSVNVRPVYGEEPYKTAVQELGSSLEKGIPCACLLLKHRDIAFDDYQWHWFVLNGMLEYEGRLYVSAVSYGYEHWLDFEKLWNSGFEEKGGLVIYEINNI